jgi:hypothetical protein
VKESIEIFLRGMVVLVFSLGAIVCFIAVPLLFKEFMNAIGLLALWKFFLMLGAFITGCFIVFALGIDSVYPDESIKK